MTTPSDIQYLTPEGLKDIEERLEYYRTVRRAQVAERLRLALEEGGELTENIEYEDAKNEQAFVEGEIIRLETIVSHHQLIIAPGKRDTIGLGAKVTIKEKGRKETETYHLVGPAEADPREGKISHESPLGKALMGRKVGEQVTVKAPDGNIVFDVKKIQ
jgi:transcription elongation factor GreA